MLNLLKQPSAPQQLQNVELSNPQMILAHQSQLRYRLYTVICLF